MNTCTYSCSSLCRARDTAMSLQTLIATCCRRHVYSARSMNSLSNKIPHTLWSVCMRSNSHGVYIPIQKEKILVALSFPRKIPHPKKNDYILSFCITLLRETFRIAGDRSWNQLYVRYCDKWYRRILKKRKSLSLSRSWVPTPFLKEVSSNVKTHSNTSGPFPARTGLVMTHCEFLNTGGSDRKKKSLEHLHKYFF